MTLLESALHMRSACLSVVPARADGSKAPAAFWKQYQTTPPTEQLLTEWFSSGAYDGLGVITGTVSGNLEMLEVEGRAISLVPQLAQLLTGSGLGELWQRLCAGYLESSPSGGWHWLYRVDGPDGCVHGNTKLARRPGEKPGTVDVLIETRGEGGFVVTAPSSGRTHPTGGAWKMVAGDATSIPVLTPDERDALHLACSTFDQMPTRDTAPAPTSRGPLTSVPTGSTDRPGDEFEAKATWEEILEPHGWTRGRRLGESTGWTRPGKNPRDGMSATTRDGPHGHLYVFSSSTEFDTEIPYTRFGAYAVLEHGCDHAAAAKELRGRGYGKPLEEPTLTLDGEPAPNACVTTQPPAPAAPLLEVPTTVTPPGGPAAAVDGSNVIHLAPSPAGTLTRSEDGHAHQLIAAYADLIRYCPQRGAWLAWDGSRWQWQPPGGGVVREYAKTVARAMPNEPSAALTHKKRCLSAAGITGCLKQAQTDARVTVNLGDLDATPFLLNTPAGVVDLHTGQLVDPDPASLCTKQTNVSPATDPDPLWESFLEQTFGTDEIGRELKAYVQRLVGVTLIGQVREQILPFLHGLGANGKSTLVETLMHALGIGETGYAIAAPVEMLMVRKHEAHPAELAQLAGARMVVYSELDEGQRFAEARVKLLTGRDSINARFLYGQPFTWQPTHTPWMVGNHRPQARTGGMAFWRRVKLVEFRHVVPPERRDPALGEKLNAAGGTVLAWAIAGAVDYLAGGIREPAIVAQATEAYAADQDTVGRFVADECHRASSDLVRINSTDLRAAYETWCREVGEQPVAPKRFGQELRDRFGVGDAKSNGRRFYTGICLLETERSEDADDDQDGPAEGPPDTPSSYTPPAPPSLPGLS